MRPDRVWRERGSGTDPDQPYLAQVRRTIEDRAIGVLLVYSPDRLARDPLQLAVIGEEREAADVQLQFVEGPSGDFAEDQLVRNIPGYIGEKERVQIPD